jgi:hypothetical protein
MLHSNFSTQVISSLVPGNGLLTDNTYIVIKPETCKVLGFTIHSLFSLLDLTITIASADQSKIYFVGDLSSVTATHIIHTVPFTAEGIAWKSTGAGVSSTFVSSTFFLSQPSS